MVAVMVGGEAEAVEKARPYLEIFGGKGVTHVGGIGAGNAVKCVNNVLNSMHLLLATEAAAVLTRANVDPQVAVEVMSRSSGMSLQLKERLPQEVLSGRYGYGFALGLMNKDVQIFQGLAESSGLAEKSLLTQASPMLQAAMEQHGPDADYTYISKYWQQQLGQDLP
jgi:3-hydroxyisobutyrate dehydrogenase